MTVPESRRFCTVLFWPVLGWYSDQFLPGVGGLVRSCGRLTSNKALHKGRSALGRSSTSRGRAAFEMNEGRRAAPAVLLSTFTYRPLKLNGKALDGLDPSRMLPP